MSLLRFVRHIHHFADKQTVGVESETYFDHPPHKKAALKNHTNHKISFVDDEIYFFLLESLNRQHYLLPLFSMISVILSSIYTSRFVCFPSAVQDSLL